MDQTNNFGMNHFQNVNNNMNQINNDNGLNNPMLNQYNQINPMLNQINTFNQNNPMLNQINTFNQNNPMLNQMNTFNKNNPMLNQINTFNQNNPILNQMNTFNQNNPMLNQMNTILNQMNIILNQMNIIINQINSYEQNNKMLNMDINFMSLKMYEINDKIKQMNQKMNQLNDIYQEKQKKEKIQNINLNNLNINQMGLINSIIKFYKENGNEYMNFDNPYQIKNIIYLLSLDYYKLIMLDHLLNYNIEDPLDYIKEPKKIIRFRDSNYKEYKVKIPLSITKYDLYSIAQNYKCFKNNNKHNITGNHSNILLIYNNIILNRDETSIECINENDIIFIIEPRNFPDDSYYKSLQKRTGEKRCIHFQFSSGKRIHRVFPDDIKIYEIYKSINLELGLDINIYKLIANGKSLEINNHKDGSDFFDHYIHINEYNQYNSSFCTSFGKLVIATIIINKQNEKISIEILNSVKDLIKEAQYLIAPRKLITIKIGNKKIAKDDTMSLFSLGIKKDFTFFVEYED